MPNVMNLVVNGLLVIGSVILIASLASVRRIIKQLPPGGMRRNWVILNALIVFFIVGYAGYALVNWNHNDELSDLVVSAILFCGACFVWLVNFLSLQTTLDIRRVALLEQENMTDHLMGICNRRYLDRRLREEFERACRHCLPLSALLVDIDRFKEINDTYGHQVGDLVLKNLAKLFMESNRAGDIVARYGGDEIFIIATNTTASSAAQLAERLRRLVESSLLVPLNRLDNRQSICVTVSIGVASLCQGTDDLGALVEKVDKALYRAKHDGRNRVILSEQDI